MPEPELVWYDRDLVGFENRLKGEDRIKDKIAESLAVKDRTVAEAARPRVSVNDQLMIRK